MANIGGNIIGTIYTNDASRKNEIGEAVVTWKDVYSTVGWLGYQSGENKRTSFNAKLEETTHVFLCDYVGAIYALADQDTRMKIKGVMYDVLLIDNPDEMDEQLEIYLRKVGARDGS